MFKKKTMADSERLPLHTVIKHLTPLLKYHKLDILIHENITSLRNSKNIQFPEMVNKICLDIFKV